MSSEVQAQLDTLLGEVQVVVPKQLRNHISKMAHDIPISGHEGMDRTLKRITMHFFWPGIVAETRQFVGSCPICQNMAGRTYIRKAPLIPIPVIETPFQKWGMDTIGPLTTTVKRIDLL